MSQPEIPDNNLPVYLQQYEVNILNTDKLRPCNDQSCVSSERGCCPDNVTPVPPSGECEIGGCAGTEFGCCPFSTEAKADAQGSNCGTIAGSVLYTTVGAIPSNVPQARVWELNLSGSLKPGVEKYYIVYDFQNVNYKYKNRITFENAVTGTFNICGRVMDANKYLDYTYCSETLLVTIIIDTKKWDFRLKKESTISYQLQIDDSSSTCCGPITKTGTLPCGYDDSRGLIWDPTTQKSISIPFEYFSDSNNYNITVAIPVGGVLPKIEWLYITINLSSNNDVATIISYQPPFEDDVPCKNTYEYNYYGYGGSLYVPTDQLVPFRFFTLYVYDKGKDTVVQEYCYFLCIDKDEKTVGLERASGLPC